MMLLAGVIWTGGLILSLVVLGIYRATRCIHAWELVDKTELPSAFETMAKAGADIKAVWMSDIPKLAARVVILALRCPKCGAARIFREESAR